MIRKATIDEYKAVLSFYYRLIDDMGHLPCFPNWQKNVYPSDDYLHTAITKGELWVYDRGGIQAAMIVNGHGEGYDTYPWHTAAGAGEYLVIHALGVGVSAQGSGAARQMVEHVRQLAKDSGMTAMRLDVLQGNTPAIRLYEKCGFAYIGDVNINYADTGETTFHLYECEI